MVLFVHANKIISIHALREEGDRAVSRMPSPYRRFLSTPSARRATLSLENFQGLKHISIHALREEGDLDLVWQLYHRTEISIHALREEGDPPHIKGDKIWTRFLSTPSARRATIHLVEHGKPRTNFYPRPPRGGRLDIANDLNSRGLFLSTPSARRATLWLPRIRRPDTISIHALREEGDKLCLGYDTYLGLFLSTPSARRATAKTETKSLFSNKLYNILHEFRRALIYNGSKNYPNHAK